MNKKTSSFIIFLLLFILGQKSIVFIFPLSEWRGIGAGEWLVWLIAGPYLEIYIITGIIVGGICSYWIFRLRAFMCAILGWLLGGYFSVLYIPFDKSIDIENIFLSSESSTSSIIFLYFVISIVVPMIVAYVFSIFDDVVGVLVKRSSSIKKSIQA